ncbi:MAG: PspA/IM30 family protein [Brooklawnia sp.]|jgi:phage shock protein A
MVGLINRISRAFGSAAKSAPEADAQDQQTELLQQVRRGAAQVAASRRELAAELNRIAAQMDSLTLTARRAVEQGRDGLAREALASKQRLGQQLGELETQHAQLQLEEEKLVITSTRLQARLDALRATQGSQGAQAAAAEARQRVDQALQMLQAGQASVAASEALLAQPVPAEPDEAGVAAELAAIEAEVVARDTDQASSTSYQQPRPGDGQIQDEWGVR